MKKETKVGILFILIVIVSLLIIKYILADEQLPIHCGGDEQLKIGCIGDQEYNNLGVESVSLIQEGGGGLPLSVSGNGTVVGTGMKYVISILYFLAVLLILLIILLTIFLIKRRKED